MLFQSLLRKWRNDKIINLEYRNTSSRFSPTNLLELSLGYISYLPVYPQIPTAFNECINQPATGKNSPNSRTPGEQPAAQVQPPRRHLSAWRQGSHQRKAEWDVATPRGPMRRGCWGNPVAQRGAGSLGKGPGG